MDFRERIQPIYQEQWRLQWKETHSKAHGNEKDTALDIRFREKIEGLVHGFKRFLEGEEDNVHVLFAYSRHLTSDSWEAVLKRAFKAALDEYGLVTIRLDAIYFRSTSEFFTDFKIILIETGHTRRDVDAWAVHFERGYEGFHKGLIKRSEKILYRRDESLPRRPHDTRGRFDDPHLDDSHDHSAFHQLCASLDSRLRILEDRLA